MKRIIYNTKLKKRVLVLLIVMLIFNFIFSSTATIVYADAESSAGDVGITRDMFYPKKMKGLKTVRVAPEDFDEYYGEGTEDSTDWDYKDWQINTLDFMAEHEGTSYASYIGSALPYFNDSLKQSWEANQAGTEKITLKEAYTKAVDAAIATAGGLEEQVDELIGDEKENGADLGGILLSPVFYLINFIADAVISITGSIMDPSNALDFGVGVLTNEKPTSKYTNTSDFEVDTKSFLPTNLSGVLSNNGSVLYQYPHLTYTPEEIFSGKIDLLSIDFITGTNYEGNQNENEGWLNIRKVISQWYQILRMIAIIGLLSVLIYTGIKIVISANAKDKAKYKEWIMNWLMAVAILFFMHIIMAFIVAITGEFSKLMNEAFQGINVIPSDSPENAFNTNLMGLVRFMIQSENFYIKVGYEVMYIALIWYTIKFTFLYLKRVLNMAFLTLIAPIVALTYPIDKINDGSAQGFDMWLKEYIFNALLQPMHCVLYYVLVGSAVGIAATNPIYGIVVLAFMSEAEKLLKKIFGFGKAGATSTTNGGMVSAFAAGTIATSLAKNLKLAGGGGKGGKGGSGGNAEKEQSLFDRVKPLKEESITNGFSNYLIDDENVRTNNRQLEERQQGGEISQDENEKEQEVVQQGGNEQELVQQIGNEQNGNQQNRNLEDNGEPIEDKAARIKAIKRGFSNVGKEALRPIYDIDRRYDTDLNGKTYNQQRWKRRGVNALKGAGKAVVGFGLGTAAAAVQAGISITDGKYNPIEGVAAFSAGYSGGGRIVQNIGGKVSNAFKDGYYDGNEEKLREKIKEEFMYSDDNDKAYRQKYGKNADEMKKLAAENMVPYGYNNTKDQFAIQKFANHIKDNSKNDVDMKDAIRQSRATLGFIGDLEKQGQKGIIGDPDKQEKYIQSILKAENVQQGTDRYNQIERSYKNAFKSAAQWQQVNK